MTQTSARPVIVVTNPVHAEVADRLASHGELRMNPGPQPWSRAELLEQLAGASAMMGFMTDSVDAALLQAAPQLRLVACALKGFDSYDVDACTEAGVWLSIVPDLLTEPTAELAIGLAIALGRHLREGDGYIRSGAFNGWRPHLYGTGLHGSVAAVVGLGQVGQAIVERLAGFGCARILGVDPFATRTLAQVEPCSLQAAMREADYLFLAVPLTGQTRHLVGAAELAQARQGQLVINVGRGSVIDEEAVAAALERGQIGGYAADVFECEDWGLPDHPPGIPPQLLAHPRTVLTPHIGSGVRRVRLAIEHRAADNIIAQLTGAAPPDAINCVLLRH